MLSPKTAFLLTLISLALFLAGLHLTTKLHEKYDYGSENVYIDENGLLAGSTRPSQHDSRMAEDIHNLILTCYSPAPINNPHFSQPHHNAHLSSPHSSSTTITSPKSTQHIPSKQYNLLQLTFAHCLSGVVQSLGFHVSLDSPTVLTIKHEAPRTAGSEAINFVATLHPHEFSKTNIASLPVVLASLIGAIRVGYLARDVVVYVPIPRPLLSMEAQKIENIEKNTKNSQESIFSNNETGTQLYGFQQDGEDVNILIKKFPLQAYIHWHKQYIHQLSEHFQPSSSQSYSEHINIHDYNYNSDQNYQKDEVSHSINENVKNDQQNGQKAPLTLFSSSLLSPTEFHQSTLQHHFFSPALPFAVVGFDLHPFSTSDQLTLQSLYPRGAQSNLDLPATIFNAFGNSMSRHQMDTKISIQENVFPKPPLEDLLSSRELNIKSIYSNEIEKQLQILDPSTNNLKNSKMDKKNNNNNKLTTAPSNQSIFPDSLQIAQWESELGSTITDVLHNSIIIPTYYHISYFLTHILHLRSISPLSSSGFQSGTPQHIQQASLRSKFDLFNPQKPTYSYVHPRNSPNSQLLNLDHNENGLKNYLFAQYGAQQSQFLHSAFGDRFIDSITLSTVINVNSDKYSQLIGDALDLSMNVMTGNDDLRFNHHQNDFDISTSSSTSPTSTSKSQSDSKTNDNTGVANNNDSTDQNPTFLFASFSQTLSSTAIAQQMRQLEQWLRTFSNAHEKLHHSTWLYLFASANLFIRMEKYTIPFVLLVCPFTVLSVIAFYSAGKPYEDKTSEDGSENPDRMMKNNKSDTTASISWQMKLKNKLLCRKIQNTNDTNESTHENDGNMVKLNKPIFGKPMNPELLRVPSRVLQIHSGNSDSNAFEALLSTGCVVVLSFCMGFAPALLSSLFTSLLFPLFPQFNSFLFNLLALLVVFVVYLRTLKRLSAWISTPISFIIFGLACLPLVIVNFAQSVVLLFFSIPLVLIHFSPFTMVEHVSSKAKLLTTLFLKIPSLLIFSPLSWYLFDIFITYHMQSTIPNNCLLERPQNLAIQGIFMGWTNCPHSNPSLSSPISQFNFFNSPSFNLFGNSLAHFYTLVFPTIQSISYWSIFIPVYFLALVTTFRK